MGKKDEKSNTESSKICFLSNFPPNECGIATFTKDLSSAMDRKFNPKLKSRIIALNDETSFYNYSNKVIMQFNKDNIGDYISIAKKVNKLNNIRLVCVQHEFGLFGGNYGDYLIPFLQTVEKPVVVTFHSVLPYPNEKRKKVVESIVSNSAAVIVMAKKAEEILINDYNIEKDKIHLVHHGIPNVPFQSSEISKKKLRLNGKTVLSTFGLLSRGKGIEYVIKSLPALVKKYPDIIYLIIGETHPTIRKEEGEKYRNELIKLVNELGLKNNVKFYNKYLTLQEIIQYLLASDIYICSNLDKDQIVSGTLSYALGCGKAIVSTPSVYAEEVLANDRGILTKFKDPDSFSNAIDKILSDNALKNKIQGNAYHFGRAMVWQNVAFRYLNVFNKVIKLREETTERYPAVKMNHLKNLTDNFGMIQFSKLSVPDKDSGYTVDDNSRALIAMVLNNRIFKSQQSLNLAKIYLNFLEYAQRENGWFSNVMQRYKILNKDSEDAFGRALWSLGYTIDKSINSEISGKAKQIFDKSLDLIGKINSPRARAFSIIGLYHYYKKNNNEEILIKIKNITDSLVELYEKQSRDNWHWFEENITYSNSKLPEALFLAYDLTKNKKYLEIAETSLNFLSEIVFVENQLSPIGQNGWYNRNGERAFFDQQPVDAASMVQTYLTAYLITGNKDYYNKAVLSFNWFLGKNHLKQMIYDESTGGCYDGLSQDYINQNQGAESSVCYLIARLMLEEVNKSQ